MRHVGHDFARGGAGAGGLTVRQTERLREQLRECARESGGPVSTRERAAALGDAYLRLGDPGRRDFLRLIATEFGPDPARVATAAADYQAAVGTRGQWDAEARLRGAMRSSRLRILTQFNALPQGVRFLVDLRADLLRFLDDDPALAALDRELETRLSTWFDVGFLELRRITWNSPAELLEKLMRYEAVHEIRSWTDLKNRLDSDRRLYAFFHPRMPAEPLIFVEVALTDRLADSVQTLLDESAPVFDARRAETAIFYSISNTQPGLKGVSFGNFLLKRVIEDLRHDFHRLRTFATLSPIPQLAAWVRQHPGALADAGIALSADALGQGDWALDAGLEAALREPLRRLAARYLVVARQADRPVDPVARFHLGNGARVERINVLGDRSPKGLRQSFGLMVNYLYDLADLEHNVDAYTASGVVAASPAVLGAAATPAETTLP